MGHSLNEIDCHVYYYTDTVRTRNRLAITLLASSAIILGVAAPASAAPSPTDLVADVVPGAGSLNPYWLTPFAGRLFFVGNDGSGDELYVSDGSVGSAVNLNLTIDPTGVAGATGFTIIGNTMYLAASDGTHGAELWSITGSGSPVMVADLNTGGGDSDPSDFTLFNSDLYFAAYTVGTGRSLFRLSGGTVTQYPGAPQSPDNLFVYNGFLYFSASVSGDSELYRLDGTNTPSQFFASNPTGFGNPHNFAVAGGRLYFISNDGLSAPRNYELYATDGTVVTKLTTDLAAIDGYQYFTVFNDTLYFSAGNAAIGRELGHTTGGAVPAFFDINAGPTGSNPEGFTAYNGSLYFGAATSATGDELFSITGSSAPVLRADINSGVGDSFPFGFGVSNGLLVFSASSTGADWQLWSFNGTAANQESEIGVPDADAKWVAVLGSYTYFAATSPATGYELWRTRVAGVAVTATPALAATGSDTLLPAGIAAALLLAGLTLAFTRRRVSETQE